MKRVLDVLRPLLLEDFLYGAMFLLGVVSMIAAVFVVYEPAGVFLAGAALVALAIGAMRSST